MQTLANAMLFCIYYDIMKKASIFEQITDFLSFSISLVCFYGSYLI